MGQRHWKADSYTTNRPLRARNVRRHSTPWHDQWAGGAPPTVKPRPRPGPSKRHNIRGARENRQPRVEKVSW